VLEIGQMDTTENHVSGEELLCKNKSKAPKKRRGLGWVRERGYWREEHQAKGGREKMFNDLWKKEKSGEESRVHGKVHYLKKNTARKEKNAISL